MSQPESTPPARRPQAAKAQIPPEVAEILVRSVQVGAGAGTIGLLVGAASGILRSTTPVLFSLVTGAQWFALSSSFYGSRSAIIQHWGGDSKISSSDKVKASSLAGASAGFVGGALRGPRNILPAIAVLSLFGATGQAILNSMPTGEATETKKKTSWLDSKWSPVTPMSDTEYSNYIQEKILKLDVEVSMVEDQLAALRARKAEREAQKQQEERS